MSPFTLPEAFHPDTVKEIGKKEVSIIIPKGTPVIVHLGLIGKNNKVSWGWETRKGIPNKISPYPPIETTLTENLMVAIPSKRFQKENYVGMTPVNQDYVDLSRAKLEDFRIRSEKITNEILAAAYEFITSNDDIPYVWDNRGVIGIRIDLKE